MTVERTTVARVGTTFGGHHKPVGRNTVPMQTERVGSTSADPPLFVITGTGRSGTTVLHEYLRRAGYPTHRVETHSERFEDVHRPTYVPHDRIIRRHPYFLFTMPERLPSAEVTREETDQALSRIAHVFLCVRDLEAAAGSWAKRLPVHFKKRGAKPDDVPSVRRVLGQLLGEWLAWAVRERVRFTVVDFERRCDPDYLREVLAPFWAVHGHVDPERWRSIVLQVSSGKRVS